MCLQFITAITVAAVSGYEGVPAWQGPAFCRPYSAALLNAERCSKVFSKALLTYVRCVQDPVRPAHTSV